MWWEIRRVPSSPSQHFWCEYFLKNCYFCVCNVEFGKERHIKIMALRKHLACLLFHSNNHLLLYPQTVCASILSVFILPCSPHSPACFPRQCKQLQGSVPKNSHCLSNATFPWSPACLTLVPLQTPTTIAVTNTGITKSSYFWLQVCV